MESHNSSREITELPEMKLDETQSTPAWTLNGHKSPSEDSINLVASPDEKPRALPGEIEGTVQLLIHPSTARKYSEWDTPSASMARRKNTSSNPKGNTTGGETVATDSSPKPHRKPTLERSWEVIMKELTSLDEGFIEGWTDDIDTLLVFAGLFSAVVTAFVVESYQWLEPAPEDTSAVILSQILQKMNNEPISLAPPFKVSSSDVFINVCLFLSLIISLVVALFALLCKQWLREHRRQARTGTPSEMLALRWLRLESLKRWGVGTIISILLTLLELALFLFLAGLLELLRKRHPVPFIIALVVVVFASFFYLGTAIIPSFNIIRQALQITPELREMRMHDGNSREYSPIDLITTLPPMEYICPYKTPQAWAIFRLTRLIPPIFGFITRVVQLLYRTGLVSKRTCIDLDRSTDVFIKTINGLTTWPSTDLELLQRSNIDFCPPFYELHAFRSLVRELRDSPIMIPHLQNILSTLPSHLVMPAVFDQWLNLPHGEWMESVLPSHSKKKSTPYQEPRQTFPDPRRETVAFNQLLHCSHVLMNAENLRPQDRKDLPQRLRSLWEQSKTFKESIPLPELDVMVLGLFRLTLSKLEGGLRKGSARNSWNNFSEKDLDSIVSIVTSTWDSAHLCDRKRLVEILSTYINNRLEPGVNTDRSSPESLTLFMSSAIRELICFVSDRLAVEHITLDCLGDANRTAWHEAVKRIANLHGRPIEDFRTTVVHGGPDSPHSSRPSPTLDDMGGEYEWDTNTLGGNDRDSVMTLGLPDSGAFDRLGGTRNKALDRVKSMIPNCLRHAGRTGGGTRVSGYPLQRKDSGESGGTTVWSYDQTKAVYDKDTSAAVNENGGSLRSPTTPDTARSFTRRRRPVGEPGEPEIKFGGAGADTNV